ncbi:putative F-box domain-containing protein [Rosellinia necatrix]|uniref:Putative F-box domain-containing protein n=1 Tax=Rosellinia necatrix TaxID=77044 RepID=A0A1S7UTW1_ROSNE|nr:putative F-box domain-containing protein [Rosellinia necatrix]
MPKTSLSEDEELGVLEDKTEALTLHSKRTERARKRRIKKTTKVKDSPGPLGFLGFLPYELAMEIITLLRPSDLFKLQRTSRPFYDFIAQEEARIAQLVSGWRYTCLEKCFRLPVLLANVDPTIHCLLQAPERQEILTIHKKPYQHIKSPEPTEVCTCLTCTLRWSALAIIVDFAHWQRHLDEGEPIPMIPRGKLPEWNQTLIAAHAAIVRKALYSPLWHAYLLEVHLDSTTRSIRRHAANKGNKRRRYRMTEDDVNSGTDAFLDRSGPPSLDFPYHRDNYYLLETFLPNRCWSQDQSSWLYVPAEQHDRDIEFVVMWAERRRRAVA